MFFVLITTCERSSDMKKKMLLQCSEHSSEIEIKSIFIKVYGEVSVVEN